MISSADVFHRILEQRHNFSGFSSFDSVALVTFRVTRNKFIQSLRMDETEIRF
jgi:hypothetical protein